MTAQIVVVSGPDKGKSYSVPSGATFQIGRSQTTSTQLSDQTVSRVHCQIEYDGKRAVLTNLSTKGTEVNGKAVTEHELRHGDLVFVGGSELRFQLAAIEEASTVLQPAGSGRPSLTQLSDLPGQVLLHYAIESIIARGQSGAVFKAADTRDGQTVAIKVLQPEFSRNEDEMQRFIRAMKTVLGLKHPNIVKLLGAGKTGPFCWVAMEYVEGESLSQVIQPHRRRRHARLEARLRVAVPGGSRSGIRSRRESVIHRNVTPTTFFSARPTETAYAGRPHAGQGAGRLAWPIRSPSRGEIVGDISLHVPRADAGTSDVDGRADLYGLGATVYALIAGRPPVTGGSLAELIVKIRSNEPEKPKKFQMSIPDLFQGTVMKLLAKRPEERFQNATDLLVDLKRVGKFSGVTVS